MDAFNAKLVWLMESALLFTAGLSKWPSLRPSGGTRGQSAMLSKAKRNKIKRLILHENDWKCDLFNAFAEHRTGSGCDFR